MNCAEYFKKLNPDPVFKTGDLVYISKGIKAEIEGVTGDYGFLSHYIIAGKWHKISKIHELNNKEEQ